MAHIDSLLTADEMIGFRTRQHPLIRFFANWHGILLIVVAFACLALDYRLGSDSGAYFILWIMAAMLGLIGSTVMAWSLLRWRAEDYVVTNRRIIKLAGIFTRTATDVSLDKINDVRFHQPRLGRFFDFGDLIILTGAGEEGDRFTSLWRAAAFKRAMLEAKEDFFNLRPSGPGGRDGDDAGLAAASTALANSPDRTDPGFEQRIGALYDLRAQNLISPAQHEAALKNLLSGNPAEPTNPA